MLEPEIFEQMPVDVFEPTACSPRPPDPAWRGVAIQAPRRVVVERGGRLPRIPVCGMYMLNVPYPVVEDTIILYAREKKSGMTFTVPVRENDPSPEEPPPPTRPLTEKDVQGLASGRYFNPNAASLPGLPALPAVYDIYVEVRGIRSNVATLEVVAR